MGEISFPSMEGWQAEPDGVVGGAVRVLPVVKISGSYLEATQEQKDFNLQSSPQ